MQSQQRLAVPWKTSNHEVPASLCSWSKNQSFPVKDHVHETMDHVHERPWFSLGNLMVHPPKCSSPGASSARRPPMLQQFVPWGYVEAWSWSWDIWIFRICVIYVYIYMTYYEIIHDPIWVGYIWNIMKHIWYMIHDNPSKINLSWYSGIWSYDIVS
jgi:hypothetical protein